MHTYARADLPCKPGLGQICSRAPVPQAGAAAAHLSRRRPPQPVRRTGEYVALRLGLYFFAGDLRLFDGDFKLSFFPDGLGENDLA